MISSCFSNSVAGTQEFLRCCIARLSTYMRTSNKMSNDTSGLHNVSSPVGFYTRNIVRVTTDGGNSPLAFAPIRGLVPPIAREVTRWLI